MSKGNVEDFLKNLGMNKQPENKAQEQSKKKHKIVKPETKLGIKVRRISDLRRMGIELPQVKARRLSPKELRERVIRLISFAKLHNFVITPVGCQYYIDGFAKFNACPCDRTRTDCPCTEGAQEVETQGKCKCQLFWKDYRTYLSEKYNI